MRVRRALQAALTSKAYAAWVEVARLTSGPVFRAIDRWGHVGVRSSIAVAPAFPVSLAEGCDQAHT